MRGGGGGGGGGEEVYYMATIGRMLIDGVCKLDTLRRLFYFFKITEKLEQWMEHRIADSILHTNSTGLVVKSRQRRPRGQTAFPPAS